MTKGTRPQRVNVFGDDEAEAPNSKFNEAIETARRQAEAAVSTATNPSPQEEHVAEQPQAKGKRPTKQTIQKTDYFTQEQLEKLDDIEYLAKKKRGKTLRRFDILGILIEQCDVDNFIRDL